MSAKFDKHDKLVHRTIDGDEKLGYVSQSKEFAIDMANFWEEIEVQPALFHYFCSVYAKAKEQERTLYAQLKVAKATVRIQLKEGGVKVANKAPTVDDLDALVLQDPMIQDLTTRHIEADKLVTVMEGAKEAARMKAEMLKQRRYEVERSSM